MMPNKTKFNKLIASIILFALLVPSLILPPAPKKAEAQFTDFVNSAWQGIQASFNAVSTIAEKTLAKLELKKLAKEVLTQVLKGIARRVLAEMTKSTVNWINTGRWGNPLFLDNPKSFFRDIAKSEIKKIVTAYGYNNLRFPFGRDFALSVIASYKRQTEENAAYTLSRAIQDEVFLEQYRSNFALGGWNGFLMHTQYPQNNYLGFQMMATQQLAAELQGTTESEAQKVQRQLQEGAGFLSPQICPSNTSRPATNPYRNPTFEPTEKWDPPTQASGESEEEYYLRLNGYNTMYQAAIETERAAWEKKYACPGGLQNTTPGSLVSNQIMKAMGVSQDQASLGAALGNSLSAIFDALLNKLIGEGLTALATKANPEPEEDEWSYMGQTLGTASSNYGDDWSTWPDEIVSISELQNFLTEGIEQTTLELSLIDDTSGEGGILQRLAETWPIIKDLDMCLPGPDIGWEDRLQKELERNSQKFMEKSADTDGKTAAAAQLAINEFNFAIKMFRDWISNKIITQLPNSVLYLDGVRQIESLHTIADGYVKEKQNKIQALARLQSIRTVISSMEGEPEPGSDDEKKLIQMKRQYNAVRSAVSNSLSVEDTRNDLLVLSEQKEKTVELLGQCERERTNAGWTIPDYTNGGANSRNNRPQGNECKLHKNLASPRFGNSSSCTEIQSFCSFPIVGGYPHNPFNTNKAFANYDGPDVTHPEIPLINADRVIYGNDCGFLGARCLFGSGDRTVDIQVNCDIVYNATPIEYKGNIPGTTNVSYVRPVTEGVPGGGESGGQCVGEGQYASVLMDAMQQVLEERSDIAELDPGVNTAPPGGREYRGNAITFLRLTAEKLGSMGYEATHEVLNGNGNPSTGDIIAVWRSGDTAMERYDAISGSAPTMRDAPITDFTGLIPLDCTLGGGGTNCACQSEISGPVDTGGGNQCSFASGTHGNDPGAPLEIDPNTVIFDQGDNVKNWAQTATLSGVSVNGDTINLPYDKASSWPSSMLDTAATVGNPWIIVWRNGAWHAVTFSWLRPGQTSKTVDDVFFGGIGGAQTFGDFKPVAGERYGFMVSGVARDMSINNIRERSNIVTYTWPSGINASCAVGGGSTGGSTSGTVGGPTISSVSPTTITAGTTVSITGTNLASTVQFFDGAGGRHTVVGTLTGTGNSARVEVVAPMGMPSGTGSVRIYKNANSVSNSINIAIGSGGAGGTSNINFTTPTKTVVPTGISVIGYLDRTYQNGWWPSISPNGRYVAFGNWGDSFVLDLESTSTTPQWNFEKPEGLPDNANCLAGQWMSNTKLTFVCEIGSSGQGGFYRYEVTVGEWIARKTNDDPQLVRASQFKAKDNHWASYLVANGQTRIARDNQVVSSNNPGGAISIAGTTLVHACTNDNQSICVRNGSTLVKTYPAKGDMHTIVTDGSYIIYGGYGGGVRGITPNGTDTNMTLSPSGYEGPAEIVNVNGARWVVSMGWGNDYTYILLRPWGSRSAIVVNAGATHVSTVYKNGNFIIAYNDDVGNIKILTVPANATRHQF